MESANSSESGSPVRFGLAQVQDGQPAKGDAPARKLPDNPAQPAATNEAAPTSPAGALALPAFRNAGSRDLRASPRYMVRWKIALIFDETDGKPTFHGWTYDLSMNGTAMLTDSNVSTAAPVTLLIAPPPLQHGGSKKVIEIHAAQVYSVYSGSSGCFRLGFDFINFKGDGMDALRNMFSHYRPSEYKGDHRIG